MNKMNKKKDEKIVLEFDTQWFFILISLKNGEKKSEEFTDSKDFDTVKPL